MTVSHISKSVHMNSPPPGVLDKARLGSVDNALDTATAEYFAKIEHKESYKNFKPKSKNLWSKIQQIFALPVRSVNYFKIRICEIKLKLALIHNDIASTNQIFSELSQSERNYIFYGLHLNLSNFVSYLESVDMLDIYVKYGFSIHIIDVGGGTTLASHVIEQCKLDILVYLISSGVSLGYCKTIEPYTPFSTLSGARKKEYNAHALKTKIPLKLESLPEYFFKTIGADIIHFQKGKLSDYKKVIDCLIARGFDISQSFSNRATPLTLTIGKKKDAQELTQYLLECGARQTETVELPVILDLYADYHPNQNKKAKSLETALSLCGLFTYNECAHLLVNNIKSLAELEELMPYILKRPIPDIEATLEIVKIKLNRAQLDAQLLDVMEKNNYNKNKTTPKKINKI